MDLNTAFSDYWELLNNYEDHLKGGYRSEHYPAPSFEFVQPQSDHKRENLPPEVTGPISGDPQERIVTCRDCDLYLARKGAIAGRGSPNPRLLIILPPPGYEEDDLALPVSGDREEFLNKWLVALGLGPEDVYLTNTVKCRTPGTRPPLNQELISCRNHLYEQIDRLKPGALLILGETALSAFSDILPSSVQGRSYLPGFHGRPFQIRGTFSLATYAPEDVLSSPDLKRPVWEDLKVLRDFLNHA